MSVEETSNKIKNFFKDLVFDEKSHTYNVDGVFLDSVTGRLKKHYIPFNRKKQLAYSAKKASNIENKKVTISQLSNNWNKKRYESASRGTNTHKYAEDFDGSKLPKNGFEEAARRFLIDHLKEYKIVCRELRVYSMKMGLAGTLDLMSEDKEGNLYILDYKTNEDLFKYYNMMYPPFNYLQNNNFNRYQLQMSYYQILFERCGLNVKGRKLIHLKPDGTYLIYDTGDFKNQILET